MGNTCCCSGECCYCTNPRDYFYRLNKKQLEIIRTHCENFSDVKYLVRKHLPFILNDVDYRVSSGFASDGVSTGFVFSNLICVDTAIMHDFLYATHPQPKKICDSVLEPCYRQYAVQLFGNKAWNSSGKRGALFVCKNDLGITVFNIYRDANYHELEKTVTLSETDSDVFNPFFEVARIF